MNAINIEPTLKDTIKISFESIRRKWALWGNKGKDQAKSDYLPIRLDYKAAGLKYQSNTESSSPEY